MITFNIQQRIIVYYIRHCYQQSIPGAWIVGNGVKKLDKQSNAPRLVLGHGTHRNQILSVQITEPLLTWVTRCIDSKLAVPSQLPQGLSVSKSCTPATHAQKVVKSSDSGKLRARMHQKEREELAQRGKGKGKGGSCYWQFWLSCDQSPICSCWVHNSLPKNPWCKMSLGKQCFPTLKGNMVYIYHMLFNSPVEFGAVSCKNIHTKEHN